MTGDLYSDVEAYEGKFCFCEKCDGAFMTHTSASRHAQKHAMLESTQSPILSAVLSPVDVCAVHYVDPPAEEFISLPRNPLVKKLVHSMLKAHVEHSAKQASFVANLGVIRETLESYGVPPNLVEQIPKSFKGAVSHVTEDLLPEEIHDICTNCEKRFFIGGEMVCPLCQGTRFKGDSNLPKASFRLFPLVPRLEKMYASEVF
jgi:hypothetical protein